MNACVLFLLASGVSFCAFAGDIASGEAVQRDVEVIRNRMLARYLPAPGASLDALAARAEGYAKALREDGSWDDVDYGSEARSRWETVNHLARVRDMTIAYRAPGSPVEGKRALEAAILKGLDLWLTKDFRNPNWWWNQIGVQLALGPTLLMLDDGVPPEQRNQGIEIMKRAKWQNWTGQNLVWGVTLQIIRGCIERKPEVIQAAYSRMYEEIHVVAPGKEGIQVDFSFHQHGPQLYSGGYGRGFAVMGAEFIHYARETCFAAPDEVVGVMKAYLLDGQQWMMRGITFDYSVMGREITRAGRDGEAMLDAAVRLAELGGPRSDELEAFAARMRSADAECPLVGNRHFWRSDYTSHRRSGYFVSVRTASKRNRRSEVCNNEGRKSHHLADGAMLVYVDGAEYRDIFPVWDWQRIPGTTCEQMEWAEKGGVGGMGETSFVGGVSDGAYGLAAMDFAREALKARKAWFCFDEAIVCLGAGIACTSPNPVLTSVNQCYLRGDVRVSGEAQALAPGARTPAAPAWVHHDSVGYIFPDQGAIHLANQTQTGRWSDIGTGSDEEVAQDVFSLWLDHGGQPAGAAYLYFVYPGISLEEFRQHTGASEFEVLSNTEQIQAVRHKASGLTQMAFWEAGALDCGEGHFIRVDQPCLLLWRASEQGIQVALSNPLNEPLTVNVETDLGLKGKGCEPLPGGGTCLVLVLPEGNMVGSSLIRTFEMGV